MEAVIAPTESRSISLRGLGFGRTLAKMAAGSCELQYDTLSGWMVGSVDDWMIGQKKERGGFGRPTLDCRGNLYVADGGNHRVLKFLRRKDSTALTNARNRFGLRWQSAAPTPLSIHGPSRLNRNSHTIAQRSQSGVAASLCHRSPYKSQSLFRPDSPFSRNPNPNLPHLAGSTDSIAIRIKSKSRITNGNGS